MELGIVSATGYGFNFGLETGLNGGWVEPPYSGSTLTGQAKPASDAVDHCLPAGSFDGYGKKSRTKVYFFTPDAELLAEGTAIHVDGAYR